MLSRISGNYKDDSSGELLSDIKEISSALYLHTAQPKALLSSSQVRSKSVGKTRASDIRPDLNWRTSNDGLLQKNKKFSPAWNWKKPLKALAHIRQRRFDVCFVLHVHSIEGLPPNLNGSRLVVQWKRKDESLSTRPCRVTDGTAKFEETLRRKCSFYVGRSGHNHSVKYEVKLFLIHASVVGIPGLDLGENWVDLARLLPLSIEELEGERDAGKWTTSFKLMGMANGAILNISFDYSVIRASHGNVNAPSDSNSSAKLLRRLGSVPINLEHWSSPLDEGKVFHQVSSNPTLELSKSIDFLYEKLNEEKIECLRGTNTFYQHLEKTKPYPGLENSKQATEFSDTNFELAEKGKAVFKKEESMSEEGATPSIGSSRIEIIDVDEILKDVDESIVKEKCPIDQFLVYEPTHAAISVCSKQSVFGESESTFSSRVVSESFDLESSSAMDKSLEQESSLEVKSSYKALKMSNTLLSLDDMTESVARDFLNMLEVEDCQYVYSSDGEPASPRERLLREFEKEALASGDFFLDFDRENKYHDEQYQDFSFSSSSQDVEENNHESKTRLLINRRKAKVLEDLETGTLMREWGLNENVFWNSPRVYSDGFGSPIELPIDDAFKLPPLGDNFGPLVRTKRGGYIRSMNPLPLRRCKNALDLIMQVSVPMVLAPELGSDIFEILQSMAAVGIQGLCSKVNVLMPLEDITGKAIHQVAEDSTSESIIHDCFDESKVVLDHNSLDQLGSFHSENKFGGIQGNTFSGYVSLKALIPLALDTIESLLIEGLRIQCGMSDQDAPSSVEPKFMDPSDVSELINFSLTLDEWSRLDSRIVDNGDQISDQMLKILWAHHADQDKTSNVKRQILGNKLTLALMVLLRDPFRNYEPVGASMLALIQAERNPNSLISDTYHLPIESRNEEAAYEFDTPLWRITEIRVSGLKTEPGIDQPWGKKTQQQSGTRWLLASGISKTNRLPFSKSKAIIMSNPQATMKRDALWSIMVNTHNQETNLSTMAGSVPVTRNPDVMFPNEREPKS